MAIESLCALMEAGSGQDLFEAVLESDCVDRGVTREASLAQMQALYAAIRRAGAGYDPALRSHSGMVGGDGAKMRAYAASGRTICGDYMAGVIAQALEMGESNACMKCIVAAPTAGSCGVLPAVLLPYQQREQLPDEAMVRALYVAGAIGQVIAAKASIAGAAGGCQAEIGTASAMAAGALCYLAGGSAQAVCHAAAIAIKSLLGLVCDPIAGLVEVPCVKRNAAGAMIAMSSADMALAGIRSAVPPDEVILAMREVGDRMDVSLRETGMGGIAATPFGQAMSERMAAEAEEAGGAS
ncbi:MAG: L-serine ammonia-lyase, iron-sulfur-dependent, subunit alpha [Clostridiales bacterium]|nr:L-serine ammonia-lyase, iron-sulfur-dependent, subunit alpha [Clostridiales bacterium]